MKLKNYDYGLMGRRVQQARKAKRYTQAELAEIINMSSKNLSQLERGMTGISIPTLISLCQALNISADYILFGESKERPNGTASVLLSKLSEEKQLQAEQILKIFVEAYQS